MQCSRCQASNDDGARFCEDCGARLELACPSCGQPVSAGKRFCRSCGAELTTGSTRSASPASYTPKHLVEKILTSKAALEGERKHVTVLFADLKGSMELLADRDPEEARRLLDPVLERMMEAVHRYEGTVNQVMGDGIMALFGAPLAIEDHAVRACYAALRMQASLAELGAQVLRSQGVPIQVRVGLNSGEVVVRTIGSDLRMDYTAVGQTTHLAARMEQIARPGSILITGGTLALAEGYVEVKPLGPVPVRGMSEPVNLYEITGAGPVRRRLQALASRSLSRFVGRDAEMDQLRRALAQAGDGRGQIVAVVGEPGVGKSRLFLEFTRSHRARGWLVIESGSVPYGKATPYLPVVDLLKAYFKIEDRDDQRQIRERVTGKLLTLDRTLEAEVPALLTVFEVPIDDREWAVLDPPHRRRRTLGAIKRLLLSESRVQPLILVFEDLHWIDTETQALLDSLIESVPTARMLVLVNYRPEYQHAWGRKTYYTQLRIDPLATENAGELLHALLGPDPSLASLKRLLIERTEGNPFFLEESVRTLVETLALTGERGAFQLGRAIATPQIPATAQAILAARIDRLAPGDKRLLQTASVIGKDVPLSLLHAVADESEDVVRRALGELQTTEFLYETRLFPDVEYTFKHALSHEATYASVLHDRRRALHARIVDAIERLYPDRLGEQAERLAHHAVSGEVWDKAITYLREAGTKAFKRAASADAEAYLRQGLQVVTALPSGADRERGELALLLALGPLLQATQGLGAPEGEQVYTRARALAERVGEASQIFQAAWGLWMFSFGSGRAEPARRIVRDLLAPAERSGDRGLLLEAHHSMWSTTFWLGEPRTAIEHSERGATLYDPEQHRSHAFLYGGHDPGVCSRLHSGLARWVLGHPDRALESSRSSVALAEQIAHPQSLVMALHYECIVHSLRRDPRAVAARVQALIAVAAEHGFPQYRSQSAILEGCALVQTGSGDAGIARIREGVGGLIGFRGSLHLSMLADAYLMLGQAPEGLRVIDEAFASMQGQWRVCEAELHRLRGELLLAHSPADHTRVEECFRQALGVAANQGARSWELRAATSLGRLLGRHGKREEAHRTLADVYDQFTEGLDTADLRNAKSLLHQLAK